MHERTDGWIRCGVSPLHIIVNSLQNIYSTHYIRDFCSTALSLSDLFYFILFALRAYEMKLI